MNVLVGLLEHFGDIVACEPVARYLRLRYPDARISWAVKPEYRELIDSHPNIDETITLNCLTEWIRLSHHHQTDLIVDLHVNYRSCQHCQVLLVKQTGNPQVNAFEWFDYGPLLEAFSVGAGLPRLRAQPRVYIDSERRVAVDSLSLPDRYCVIHREGSSGEKRWSAQGWQHIVRLLHDELNLPVVEVGGGCDDCFPPIAAHDVRGKTSLLETAEVIRRAKLFVGIDSGPAHLANAVQAPAVLLLGRIGLFRKYSPYTGFYAGKSPLVRILRHLAGPVTDLPVADVEVAVRYLSQLIDCGEPVASSLPEEQRESRTVHPEYRRIARDSGLFEPSWYSLHYGDSTREENDLFDFYLSSGAAMGHSPGPNFDADWYRSQRPDLHSLTDPLEHYLLIGQKENLRPLPPLGTHHPITGVQVAENFVTSHNGLLTRAQDIDVPRIFALYLPQFHPIPENDYGHRPGFTEWHNVVKAKPLFKGHYQPRIPGELGYYDLRSVDVMRSQIQMANAYGISGFCFYYYFFQGKKLLYQPIQNYLDSDITAPFFVLWANENWTRRWDGGDSEIIVEQRHSPEDNRFFIRGLFSTFTDSRYVKIDGKPLLGIYKSDLFPDINQATDIWREEAEKAGFPGLYLITVGDWHQNPSRPREIGFDAYYELPLNIVPEEVWDNDRAKLGLPKSFEGQIIDYRKFASLHMGRPEPDYTRFRTVMAPWDNSPRYGLRALIQTHTDDDSYRLWMSQALLDTSRRFSPGEQIVLLHSWNEWCEGTYVEPDGQYGRRLLEETKRAVATVREILATEAGNCATDIALLYRRFMSQKDDGSARYFRAMREDNLLLHNRLEQQGNELIALRSLCKRQTEQSELERAETQRLAADLQQSRDFIGKLHSSRSWRLTSPFRSLGRFFE